jgi:putative nucleotidyltransferase with HDIG domain
MISPDMPVWSTPLATAIETKIKQERLLHIIECELQDLPPLPAVVVRVMQTINEPSTSAADLNRLISSDQALSGKILRLVNSSYYGFPRRIATITHAIVILGFNTIRNLATSLGVAKAFDQRGPSALDRDQFWAHSVATAVGAWIIARRRNLNAKVTEEVFVGGLLHDLGKLFLDQYFPDQYAIAVKLARAANISIWDAEKTALGIGHVLVGKRVAEKWNLPPTLMAMIALHHQPSFAKEHFETVAIVHAADRLARKLKLGDGGDPGIPPLDPEVEKWLNFSPQVWEAVEQDTIKKFEDAKDFMKISIS